MVRWQDKLHNTWELVSNCRQNLENWHRNDTDSILWGTHPGREREKKEKSSFVGAYMYCYTYKTKNVNSESPGSLWTATDEPPSHIIELWGKLEPPEKTHTSPPPSVSIITNFLFGLRCSLPESLKDTETHWQLCNSSSSCRLYHWIILDIRPIMFDQQPIPELFSYIQ